jgi:hypothetical protein
VKLKRDNVPFIFIGLLSGLYGDLWADCHHWGALIRIATIAAMLVLFGGGAILAQSRFDETH